MVLLRMLAFRPADADNAPTQPLKSVGINPATVDSRTAVARSASAAPHPVTAPSPAPVSDKPAPVAAPDVQPAKAEAEEEIDLPWNEPKAAPPAQAAEPEPEPELEPEPSSQPASESVVEIPEPVLDTVAEQPDLTPMPAPVPASPVPEAPEVESSEQRQAAADAVTPQMIEHVPDATPYVPAPMERDDEPPPDDDYIEPDIDIDPASFAYLDDLAHEAVEAVEKEPELLPAAKPATGLAAEWLELFPKLPISGMTGSIAANCTLISVEGDNWLLHLDPAHSALFNSTQQRRLNDALNQYHERTLNLSIELIKPEQETPAQAAARRRADRQKQAEAAIHGDPFIQQMMQQFGASIRDDTIVPVDAPTQA
jgi:DNA polymerase-3 subunit gamma/tau